MLNEVSQSEKQTLHDLTNMKSLKTKQTLDS